MKFNVVYVLQTFWVRFIRQCIKAIWFNISMLHKDNNSSNLPRTLCCRKADDKAERKCRQKNEDLKNARSTDGVAGTGYAFVFVPVR